MCQVKLYQGGKAPSSPWAGALSHRKREKSGINTVFIYEFNGVFNARFKNRNYRKKCLLSVSA
jgi:hypothetical protein